ncbi:unnamed protein product, partial [Pylaiella littoralis]
EEQRAIYLAIQEIRAKREAHALPSGTENHGGRPNGGAGAGGGYHYGPYGGPAGGAFGSGDYGGGGARFRNNVYDGHGMYGFPGQHGRLERRGFGPGDDPRGPYGPRSDGGAGGDPRSIPTPHSGPTASWDVPIFTTKDLPA